MSYQFMKIQVKQIKVIALVSIFYIFPPAAIVLHLVPFNFRFLLLATIAPLLFFIKPLGAISNRDLGITRHNLNHSIAAITPVTLFLALLTVVSAVVNGHRYDNSNLSAFFYIFYVLISCPLQEFAYRGYLFPALDMLSLEKWARIILAAVLYSFLHIIYMDFYILFATLIAGLLWNIHYDKYRSLAGVTISHAIVGVLILGLELI